MQHQRDWHGAVDLGDQVKVEHGVPAEHRVRAAYRDREGVYASRSRIGRRLVRLRPRPRRMHAVLAADLTQLRLDPDGAVVAPGRHGGRGATLASCGRIDASNMIEPIPMSTAALTSGSEVAWSRCTTTGTAADLAMARQARPIGASGPVISHAVLADLQDDRCASGLSAGDDSLGVLDADHVEGADGRASPDDLGHRYGGHSGTFRPGTGKPARSRSYSARSNSPATGDATVAAPSAAACRSRSGQSQPRASPSASPATTASPAPVGFRTVTSGEPTCQ